MPMIGGNQPRPSEDIPFIHSFNGNVPAMGGKYFNGDLALAYQIKLRGLLSFPANEFPGFKTHVHRAAGYQLDMFAFQILEEWMGRQDWFKGFHTCSPFSTLMRCSIAAFTDDPCLSRDIDTHRTPRYAPTTTNTS